MNFQCHQSCKLKDLYRRAVSADDPALCCFGRQYCQISHECKSGCKLDERGNGMQLLGFARAFPRSIGSTAAYIMVGTDRMVVVWTQVSSITVPTSLMKPPVSIRQDFYQILQDNPSTSVYTFYWRCCRREKLVLLELPKSSDWPLAVILSWRRIEIEPFKTDSGAVENVSDGTDESWWHI